MKTVCKENMCAGCMACLDVCSKNAIIIQDSLNAYNAVIDEKACIGCNACHKVCQHNHTVAMQKPIQWWQGWTTDAHIRRNSSSGGLGNSLARTFFEKYGNVCACVFKDGEFRFEFAGSLDDIDKFSGSKYVKSNPIHIYMQIQSKLKSGEKVLFIGLPCQVAAVKLYVSPKYLDSLYTIDLICHGSPSPLLLDMFMENNGVSLKKIKDIQFRKDHIYHIYNENQVIVSERVQDLYTFAFLKTLDYTENCYSCKYATIERASDITLGDSWGSELEAKEQKKGISLILCQTPKGVQLVQDTNLHLEDVNLEKAIDANHQLKSPSEMPPQRDKFFSEIKRCNNFKKAIKKTYSKVYYKKLLKLFLVEHGFYPER